MSPVAPALASLTVTLVGRLHQSGPPAGHYVHPALTQELRQTPHFFVGVIIHFDPGAPEDNYLKMLQVFFFKNLEFTFHFYSSFKSTTLCTSSKEAMPASIFTTPSCRKERIPCLLATLFISRSLGFSGMIFSIA